MAVVSSLEPDKLVIIGASTGGPKHIQKIISSLKPGFGAAVVIAQHMDAQYIPSFVRLLDSKSEIDVHEICSSVRLKRSSVYVCSCSFLIRPEGRNIVLTPVECREKGYNPNIDTLFASAVTVAKKAKVLAVILTGIGDDGANGCLLLSQAGGTCVAESEESAIVFGMPMRAYELNNEINVQHLDDIIETVKKFGA